MKKKYISYGIWGLVLGGAVSFVTYCFLPLFSLPIYGGPGHIYITDRNGLVITDMETVGGYFTPLKEVPTNSLFIRSLVTIEDEDYYSHFGVSISSKLRALRDNLSGYPVSGGSTITEQYIKNTYFLGAPRSYLQKAREALLGVYFSIPYLSSFESKGEIKERVLREYLDTIYFGNHIYGLGGAMGVYFGKKDIDTLTEEEITILLALIHEPSVKSLKEKSFQNYMQKIKTKLGFQFEPQITKLAKKENIDQFPFVTNRWCPSIKEQGGQCILQASIDAGLQQFAKDILSTTLLGLSEKHVTNGAIFALNPHTGEIIIYQGSKGFYASDIDGQVDVIQSPRQPGSTMKPFLYLLALESGATPDDLVLDLENKYNNFEEGTVYISENYSLKEYGIVRLKEALGNSLNNASVRLAFELGLKKVYDFYKEYGFILPESPEYYGHSLVLGNPSIRLEDLVRSYVRLLPDSGVGEAGDDSPIDRFLLYQMLSDPDNRGISFGVNSLLNTSIPQAVKTGTSSEFRDNTIVSYHPDFVIGIWVGNNDNSSMQGVTGITGTAYIWHQIIEKAIQLGYIQDREIPLPVGGEPAKYCLDIPCYRTELIDTKEGTMYYSRIADGVYDTRDMFEKLGQDEKNKLKNLGIQLR